MLEYRSVASDGSCPRFPDQARLRTLLAGGHRRCSGRDRRPAAIDIPREHVRARTMAKIERERGRFIAFVQEIVDREGGHTDFSAEFAALMTGGRLKLWTSTRAFATQVVEALAGGKASEKS